MDVEALREYYVKDMGRWRAMHLRRWATVLEHLGGMKSVLDVGCGCGDLRWVMFEQGMVPEYTGIDIIPEHLQFAMQTMPYEQWICGDFAKHDFGGKKYDAVLSICMFSGNGYESSDVAPIMQKMFALSNKVIILLENQEKLFPDIIGSCLGHHFKARTTPFEEILIVASVEEFLHERQRVTPLPEVRD